MAQIGSWQVEEGGDKSEGGRGSEGERNRRENINEVRDKIAQINLGVFIELNWTDELENLNQTNETGSIWFWQLVHLKPKSNQTNYYKFNFRFIILKLITRTSNPITR